MLQLLQMLLKSSSLFSQAQRERVEPCQESILWSKEEE